MFSQLFIFVSLLLLVESAGLIQAMVAIGIMERATLLLLAFRLREEVGL